MVDNNAVHVVSFVTIMISVIAVNFLVLDHQTLTDQQMNDMMIVDVTAFAGLSFYGFGVSWNQSGLTVQTDPNKKAG